MSPFYRDGALWLPAPQPVPPPPTPEPITIRIVGNRRMQWSGVPRATAGTHATSSPTPLTPR